MARLAVSVPTPANQPKAVTGRTPTTNPTGDCVVDIDLTKITTLSQLHKALERAYTSFAGGSELTP
jgi:hypothetical protein